jgi:cytochrome c oxidase subunit 2
MLLIGLVASLIGNAVVLAIDWFPVGATKSANQIDTLYDVLLLVSVPIFVLVMTVAIYSVVRYRARPGDMGDGPPIHGHTKLEVVWVTIPFIIVTTLAIYSWIVLNDVEAKKPNEMTVKVYGQQFAWHFQYPSLGNLKSDQLYLPKDQPVKFDIATQDVIHSFWVPSFRLKSDAVPGITTHWRVTPDRLGRYDIVCAELCGLGHATMRQYAYVVPWQQFNQWVERQRRLQPPGGFPTKPLPQSEGAS